MLSMSKLRRHCGHPRLIEIREAGPDHDRVACAKKRDRATGKPKGCRTCGRHSPRCESEGICVICSSGAGHVVHRAIETWRDHGFEAACANIGDRERGWMELLGMTWAPPEGCQVEIAVGLGPDGSYVPVRETAPDSHVYEATNGAPLLTAGRLDATWALYYPDCLIAVVRDWKSGGWDVTPVESNAQLTAGGFAEAARIGAQGFIREVYYLRDGRLDADEEPVMLASQSTRRMWDEVVEMANLDDSPRPGVWCDPCWDRRTKRCQFAQQPEVR